MKIGSAPAPSGSMAAFAGCLIPVLYALLGALFGACIPDSASFGTVFIGAGVGLIVWRLVAASFS